MPFHTNKIGDFSFLDIQGIIPIRRQVKEIIERFGRDGTIFRKTGRRGRSFQLQTINYVASFSEAKTKLEAYRDLCDEDVPIEVIKHSVNWGTYIVLDVFETREPFAIFNALGGFDGGEEIHHEVTFVLHS